MKGKLERWWRCREGLRKHEIGRRLTTKKLDLLPPLIRVNFFLGAQLVYEQETDSLGSLQCRLYPQPTIIIEHQAPCCLCIPPASKAADGGLKQWLLGVRGSESANGMQEVRGDQIVCKGGGEGWFVDYGDGRVHMGEEYWEDALSNRLHRYIVSKIVKNENARLVSSLVIAGSIGSGTVGTGGATSGL